MSIAIITARGGSKRIPDKNIREFFSTQPMLKRKQAYVKAQYSPILQKPLPWLATSTNTETVQ